MINFYFGKLSTLLVGILQRDYFSVKDSFRYKMVRDSNFSVVSTLPVVCVYIKLCISVINQGSWPP